MDPNETSQEKGPKRNNDGLKGESPKGLTEEEPKDNDDGHKEEDRKPERALLWLQNGEDPEPKTMRHCCLKVHWRCRRSLRIPRSRAWRSI